VSYYNRDWSNNEYFNCTKIATDNPSAERCGVPYSCCVTDLQQDGGEDGLINRMCGYGVQELPDKDVVTKVANTGAYSLGQPR
jgi:hypothetical protein